MFLLTLYATLVVFGSCAPSLPVIAGNLAEYVIPASKGQVQEVQTQSQANTLREAQLQATVDALVAEVNALTPVRVRIYPVTMATYPNIAFMRPKPLLHSCHGALTHTYLRRASTALMVCRESTAPTGHQVIVHCPSHVLKFGLCVPYRGCPPVSYLQRQSWRDGVCTVPCMGHLEALGRA